MTTLEMVDRLAEHRTLSKVDRAELEWLVAHGAILQMSVGDVLSRKGQPVTALYIILTGRLAIFVDRGNGANKTAEWHGGDVSGMLPYSRMVTPPGEVRALEPVEVLAIPQEHFRELTRDCPQVTSILVHTMIDRARHFTSTDMHNEKLVSLGNLAAGMAHELNNPASAMERCAAILEDRLEDSENATRDLVASILTEQQMAAVDALRTTCLARPQGEALSPLDRLDREEAFAEWLSRHNLDCSIAEVLADTEVCFASLDQLAEAIDGPALNAVLRWAAAGCAVRNLTTKIQESAMTVASLVTAIKGFTHMDHAHVAEPVDLGASLDSTLTVLRAKARERSATVTLEVSEDLPRVLGIAGELNQIWGNLLENALDAIGDGGSVEMRAKREGNQVVVRIRDNGPGIPAEVKGRIFDPFFSTKPLGRGTGLGLDIVRRLVRHNDGSIDFDSRPGQTDFRVRLPIAEE